MNAVRILAVALALDADAELGFEQDPTQMSAPKIGAAATATGGVRPGGKVICFVRLTNGLCANRPLLSGAIPFLKPA
jgi:hypothetical protein